MFLITGSRKSTLQTSQKILKAPQSFRKNVNFNQNSQMRNTKKVSMWPVGLCTKTGLSTPIVKNGKFYGFFDGWIAGRKFPVDMAGFAINVEFLLQRPKAIMPYKAGFEEDGFLKSLAPFEPREIELKAKNCTKILVWHTQTKKNDLSPPIDKNRYAYTNILQLKELIV